MTDIEEVPGVAEDQRAPDQDTAIEEAFVAGTLPEEDRREEPVVEDSGDATAPFEIEPPVNYNPPTPDEAYQALDDAGVGTVLEKQAHGWKLKLVRGGTVLLSEGATISLALHRQ